MFIGAMTVIILDVGQVSVYPGHLSGSTVRLKWIKALARHWLV